MTQMTTAEIFAGHVREQRESAHISQAELAKRVSDLLGVTIHHSAIMKIEKRRREVKIDEAVAIAEALGVSLLKLVHEEDQTAAQLQQLRHELWQVEWQVSKSQAEAAEARACADAIRQQIDALETGHPSTTNVQILGEDRGREDQSKVTSW